jgi:hypothetical protein
MLCLIIEQGRELVQITIKNDSLINISGELINEFRSCSNIIRGKILLVFSKYDLPNQIQAVCVPTKFIEKYAPHYSVICDCSNTGFHECCIAISKEWCDQYNKLPAYFSYLVGHEIGHAKVCIEDIKLHLHCCLVHDFIYQASGGKVHPDESPHEQLFDRFGKYLSAKLHGPFQLINEIKTIESSKSDFERKRLTYISSTPPSNDFSGLREKLIAFSIPYKDELIKLWKNHIKYQEEKGEFSLAKEIPNHHELFETV